MLVMTLHIETFKGNDSLQAIHEKVTSLYLPLWANSFIPTQKAIDTGLGPQASSSHPLTRGILCMKLWNH